MRARKASVALAGAMLVAALALGLGGCTYDYLQHSDRVAYRAGDAVKANLESETIDPSKRSMYDRKGLGKNGYVILPPGAESASTTAPATTTTSSTTPPPPPR